MLLKYVQRFIRQNEVEYYLYLVLEKDEYREETYYYKYAVKESRLYCLYSFLGVQVHYTTLPTLPAEFTEEQLYKLDNKKVEELILPYMEKTVRCLDARIVYVFSGSSMLGKSTLAQSSTLDSWELEQSKELPVDLNKYSIFVCSPQSERIKETTKKVLLEQLSTIENIKVVEVSFT